MMITGMMAQLPQRATSAAPASPTHRGFCQLVHEKSQQPQQLACAISRLLGGKFFRLKKETRSDFERSDSGPQGAQNRETQQPQT
jgi:hypothetical protein